MARTTSRNAIASPSKGRAARWWSKPRTDRWCSTHLNSQLRPASWSACASPPSARRRCRTLHERRSSFERLEMDQTARFALPYLAPGQLQKELFHNEALQRVDMLLCPVVEGPPAASPPVSPTAGSCYLVGSGASGAWAGNDGALACFTEGGWRFAAPTD